MNSTHFEIRGLHARVDGSRVVLMRGTDHNATITLRARGAFSLVARARGHAGRLPDAFRDDMERATSFVLDEAWPAERQSAA